MARPKGSTNKPKGDNVDAQTAEHTETAPTEATSKGDVAIFHAARLPYHDAIKERFGVDKGQWKVLVEAIYPAAKTPDAIVLALTYCKSRNLDPFKRPVHIVPMWDSQRGGYVETVWPGISELRTTASRTAGYAGCDEAEFGEEKTVAIEGRVKRNGAWETEKVTATFPEWCRITLYRVVAGQRCKFVGPKVKWLETYATQGASDLPNKMWQERPEGQLEKCAEAAALRRAFPEEIGNELTAEEMTGRNLHDMTVDVTAITPASKDAGPPRTVAAEPQKAIAAPEAAQGDVETARDATPPRRSEPAQAATAAPPRTPPKADPISTGPAKKATAPQQGLFGGSSDIPKPHRIISKGETYESWAEKYIDAIKTAPDSATVAEWGDANVDNLRVLKKGKPSVSGQVDTAIKRTMEALNAEKEERAKQTAAKQATKAELAAAAHDHARNAPVGEMDDTGGGEEDMAGPGSTRSDPDVPQNPEDILAIIQQELYAVEEADQLQDVWDRVCEPLVAKLDFPPDQDAAQAIFQKHEQRLGAD